MNNPITGLRFHWGLVFSRDHNTSKPFSIHPFESMPEIPRSWIEYRLPNSFRHRGIELEVTGQVSALFAKIEYGKGIKSVNSYVK